MTSEPQPAALQSHRFVAQCIVNPLKFGWPNKSVPDIATEVIERHVNEYVKAAQPTPAEPSVVSDAVPVPTVPGWYECRRPDATVRIVRWFDGTHLKRINNSQSERFNPSEYTDFRRLVPAAGVEELVRACRAVEWPSVLRCLHDDGGWNSAAAEIEKITQLREAIAALETGKGTA